MKNIFVFPCGSEIALELHRSLKNSIHFKLIGGNSVSDHGRFVFENYIGDIPFVGSEDFIPTIRKIVKENNIDYIYPAMDSVITRLKQNEAQLGCMVIASPVNTTEICLSKDKTYDLLKGKIPVPQCYALSGADNIEYPVFCKPKVGYGSRGTKKIYNSNQLRQHMSEYPDSLIMEFLSGDEYTVDCFTDRKGRLLFYGPRKRNRVSNGISVNTYPVDDCENEFYDLINKINSIIEFRGAWFAQFKRNESNQLVLMEIASRLGGSSSLFRGQGVNFAQLSLFDAMGYDVSIVRNQYPVEMDRALDNKYMLDLDYDEVFIDYDDTIILEKNKYNTDVIKFLYQCKNDGKKITVLSSHEGNLQKALEEFGILHLINRVIHIDKKQNKADYIDNKNSVFIDDSFAERKRVSECGIPVFSVDMVECLIKD